MSAYEELEKRCHKGCDEASYYDVGFILAEVLRTLEAVTPEMWNAYDKQEDGGSGPRDDWLAMLRASPLVQP